MIALNILLGVLAFVCLLFIVGEPKPPISDRKRGNITTAFVAIVFLIIAANTISPSRPSSQLRRQSTLKW